MLSRCIVKSEVVAFEDAGPEALFRLEVERFPAVVINDVAGNDYYEMVAARRPLTVSSPRRSPHP